MEVSVKPQIVVVKATTGKAAAAADEAAAQPTETKDSEAVKPHADVEKQAEIPVHSSAPADKKEKPAKASAEPQQTTVIKPELPVAVRPAKQRDPVTRDGSKPAPPADDQVRLQKPAAHTIRSAPQAQQAPQGPQSGKPPVKGNADVPAHPKDDGSDFDPSGDALKPSEPAAFGSTKVFAKSAGKGDSASKSASSSDSSNSANQPSQSDQAANAVTAALSSIAGPASTSLSSATGSGDKQASSASGVGTATATDLSALSAALGSQKGGSAAFAGKPATIAANAQTPAQFVEQNQPKIVSGIQGQLLPHGGTMQIRLDPPELGALQVTVHMHDGVMTASFETSSDHATKLLSHGLGQLKSGLEAAGMSVEKLHVEQAPKQSFSNDSEGDFKQPPQEQQQQAQQDQQRREMVQRMWRKLAGGGDPLDMLV